MDRIKSYDEISETIQRIKIDKKFYTNFYLDESECEHLISVGNLLIVHKTNSAFILKKYRSYYFLYFLSNSLLKLQQELKELNAEYPIYTFICDLIGAPPQINEQVATFTNSGFYKYESLRRMSRRTAIEKTCDENIILAEKTDVEVIKRYFEENFDELSEHIPTTDELLDWVDKKSVICYKLNSILAGFVIYEINGLTSYLRYWFVNPEHRDKKIGSKLLKAFFCLSNETKRQLFWVIEKNENAINRYIHYGFNFENLYNIVLINKKKDERTNY